MPKTDNDDDDKDLKVRPEKDPKVTIEPADDDDDKDDEKQAAGKPEETPEQKASRRERRQERKRIHDALEEERAARQRTEREFQEHRARTDREIAIMRAERLAEQAKKEPAEDPVKKAVAPVRAEMRALLSEWRGMSDEQQAANRDSYTTKMEELEDRLADARAEAIISKRAPTQQSQQRQMSGVEVMLRTEYPALFAPQNAQAARWAERRYDLLVAEGQQEGPHLSKQCAQEALEKYGLGGNGGNGRSQANDVDRRRHISISRGGREGGGTEPKTVVMTREYRQMADAAYSHIKDQKERYATWAREVGPDADN